MSQDPQLRPPAWRRYLRFWRPDTDADVDEELRFHLDARADDLIGQGLSRERAAAQALGEFGDMPTVRDRLRAIDRRVIRKRAVRLHWNGLGHDLWYAVRRLWGSPGFTVAATVTLTIAIGATASVFGIVDGVLLKPLPFRDLDRVLVIWEANPSLHLLQFPVSPADYLDWRAQNRSFVALAAMGYGGRFTVSGAGEPENLGGAEVTPNYFSVLGVTPVVGRFLSADSGGPTEIVISYRYWQRRFGGTRSALGQTLTLDDRPGTIVGVMPAGLPGDIDMWRRLNLSGAADTRSGRFLQIYGRLKVSVTPDDARRDLEFITTRLAQEYPDADEGWRALPVSLSDSLVGDVRLALIMVLSAAGCVLLIGAANLANLFLVRCLARERELTIRSALGATRGRLVRELVAEAIALGVVGSATGVGFAVGGVHILRALAPSTFPRLDQTGIDWRVVTFCGVTLIATVLIFGLLPAWHASRNAPAGSLKEGLRGTGSAQHHRVQDTLVVIQVGVALVLLTGAGLLMESFERLVHTDSGFRPSGIITAQIALPVTRYSTPEERDLFTRALLNRLGSQPDVHSASVSSAVPTLTSAVLSFTIIGDPNPDPAHTPTVDLVCASPGYLQTLGIKLLRGRWVLATDVRTAQKVAVIDDVLARQFFAGRDPIGQGLDFGDTIRVVGVVSTVKQRGLAASHPPQLYAPQSQCPGGAYAYVAVRTTGTPETYVRGLRRVIADVDPTIPVFDIETMSDRMAQSLGTTRFATFLASLFAVVALVLGVVGIYSILSYVVAQRQREIGVRLALGASRSQVMGGVLRHAAWLTSVGIVSGSLVAWILTRALASLFLGISPHDPMIFGAAAATFGIVALLAASVPAFRTTQVDPVIALTTL